MKHYRADIKNYDILNLGNFLFQSGEILPEAKLAYKTLGRLNEDKSNVILLTLPVTGTQENAIAIH